MILNDKVEPILSVPLSVLTSRNEIFVPEDPRESSYRFLTKSRVQIISSTFKRLLNKLKIQHKDNP